MKINVNIDDLNSKQEEIANDILFNSPDTKYFAIRASRQSGKSYLIQRLAIYLSLSVNNLIIGFISYSHKQNRKNYRDINIILDPVLINKKSDNDGGRFIEFINGTRLEFYSSINYDSIVGNSFDHLVCDEFALYKEMAWQYIRPVTAAKKNAKVILASTPRGRNHFYQICNSAKCKGNKFEKEYVMLYTDNEFYDLREVENAKKSLPEYVWKQEYLGQFIFGKSPVFGNFVPFQTVKSWEEPIQNKKYFFGLDISGDGEDSTVLTIIDEIGKVCFIYEAERERVSNQSTELEYYIKRYNAIGYGEVNGLGLGLCELLQDSGCQLTKFWSDNASKQIIISQFLTALSSKSIELPTIEICPKLDNELSTFIVKRTPTGNLQYSHDLGLHDDTVISLLLANHARLEMISPAFSVYQNQNTVPNIPYPTTLDLINYNEDNYDNSEY
jgi:hypothetical protein